ncbi:MAG: hypothetical protein M1825_006118 [Sarcosagium campestre]|nr:MAG: hypothetical protein M1825_006118 [Sarcosagium campestre]
MLQRRFSHPFDCRVRPVTDNDPNDTIEIELRDMLDERFRLGENVVEVSALDPVHLAFQRFSWLPSASFTPYSTTTADHLAASSRRAREETRWSATTASTTATATAYPRRLSRQLHRQRKLWTGGALWRKLGNLSRAYFDAAWEVKAAHVGVCVPIAGARDHLALEKTYLSYLRTAFALSMAGVIIAQLWQLQRDVLPPEAALLSFDRVAKPLAAACQVAAVGIAILGAIRFWRQQAAMLRGCVWAGGWEMRIIGSVFALGTITVFIIVLVVDVEFEKHPP